MPASFAYSRNFFEGSTEPMLPIEVIVASDADHFIKSLRLFDISELFCKNRQQIFFRIVFILPEHRAAQSVLLDVIAFLLYRALVVVRDKNLFLGIEYIRRLRLIVPVFYKSILIF